MDYLSCRVVEAVVGRDATLDFYDLEESTARSRRASVFAATQAEGSRLNVCSIYLNGGMTRNEFYPRYLDERCATRLGGLVIGGGSQIIDNATYIAILAAQAISYSNTHCSIRLRGRSREWSP